MKRLLVSVIFSIILLASLFVYLYIDLQDSDSYHLYFAGSGVHIGPLNDTTAPDDIQNYSNVNKLDWTRADDGIIAEMGTNGGRPFLSFAYQMGNTSNGLAIHMDAQAVQRNSSIGEYESADMAVYMYNYEYQGWDQFGSGDVVSEIYLASSDNYQNDQNCVCIMVCGPFSCGSDDSCKIVVDYIEISEE